MPEKADTRQARAERQAKALRENLKRRKAQSRSRRADAAEGRPAKAAAGRDEDGEESS